MVAGQSFSSKKRSARPPSSGTSCSDTDRPCSRPNSMRRGSVAAERGRGRRRSSAASRRSAAPPRRRRRPSRRSSAAVRRRDTRSGAAAARARRAPPGSGAPRAAQPYATRLNRRSSLADDGAGERPALRRRVRRGRRRLPAPRPRRVRRAADPEREGQHSGKPQREHPVIIIDAFMPSTAAIAWLPWSAEAFARARTRGQAGAAVDRADLVPATAPRWTARASPMPASRRWSTRSFVADPRRRRSPARHQRALQPRRLADDGVPDPRRRRAGRRHLRRAAVGWPTCCERVADAFAPAGSRASARARERDAPARRSSRGGRLRPGTARSSWSTSAFDAQHGGFGGAPKFPHVAPVHLALRAVSRSRDPSTHRDIAITTLDAMGWGPLYDERTAASSATRGAPTGASRTARSCSTSTRRCSTSTSTPSRRCSSRATPSGPRTCCATCRPGSPIRSTADGPGRSAPTPTTTSAEAGGGSADGACRRRSIARSIPTGTRRWRRPRCRAGRALSDAVAVRVRDPLARTDRRCCATGPAAAWRTTTTATPQVRGLLDDQIAMAAAQLDAFEATGNVVYRNAGRGARAARGRTPCGTSDGGGFFDRARRSEAGRRAAARTAASRSPPTARRRGSCERLARTANSRATRAGRPDARGDRRRARPAKGRWPPSYVLAVGRTGRVINCAFASGG